MSTTREKFLRTASQLMEKQGYHATGLNEIIEKSGAPKGSLYYHFPGGKEQIAVEVILQAGKSSAERILEKTRDQPSSAAAIRDFLYMVAKRMEETDYYTGSTLTLVAMESTVQYGNINLACRQAYGNLINSFGQILSERGMDDAKARGIAEMIVAAVEGGIILSRTYHSADHLRRVANHIHQMLKALESQTHGTV